MPEVSKMTKCIFITATGTDIGKTYISALIVKKMREEGLNCGYYKPILSGAVNGIPGDCKYVTETAGLNCNPMDCLTYCFEEAVSPHLAAKRQNIVISKEKILEDFKSKQQEYDYLLIEGAGGITCPINLENKYLMNDLIKDMGADIVIVADGGLGTINSVLLTVEYAQKRNLNIRGIILNNYKDNFIYEDNVISIEKLTGLNILTTVQRNDTDIKINKKIFKEIEK